MPAVLRAQSRPVPPPPHRRSDKRTHRRQGGAPDPAAVLTFIPPVAAALPHLLKAAEGPPRQVADLINISSVAGRVARSLSIEALSELALALAARMHWDSPPGIKKADSGNNSEGDDSSFESLVMQMAEAILAGRRNASQAGVAEGELRA